MTERTELISSAFDFDEATGMYKCRWCPCIFCTLEDFIRHWKAVGKYQFDHRRKWKEMMQRAGKYG